MYLDVLATCTIHKPGLKIVGGTYGIASKNFPPDSVISIYEDLERENPK